MTSMRAMVVRSPGALALEERSVPQPGRGEIRIRVRACGVCHSDHFVTDALWPGLQLPRVPGHEVAGEVDALGPEVTRFRKGDRVGVGWHGGHDGTCRTCLTGRFIHCSNARITGISMDGGYQEYLVAPEVAAAPIPEGMADTDAAPLMCAGLTTFNALRHTGARPGDRVAIHGIGGLGHLALQYARAMGFEVVAVSGSADKEAFARRLGAHHFVSAGKDGSASEALQAMGGAQAILATAPNARAISSLVAGLAVDGTLMVVGAPMEPIQATAGDLIGRDARIQGWSSGTAADSADAMAFAARHGIKPMIETFPLPDAPRAVEAMMKGRVRFRAVLTL